jgi:hypothetical protein
MKEKQNIKKGLFSRFLPKDHDFYADLTVHSEKVQEGIRALVLWFKTGEPSHADRVRKIEHEADALMLKIASALGEVFSTPIDREDIHQVSRAMDQIINYAKNTVREIQIFNITPDEYMHKISLLILDGACSLNQAIQILPSYSPEIAAHLDKAKKCEHRVEKIYRTALNKLFEGDDLKEILKRREVYRHLSNTADRILEAADILSLILVKYG